MGQDWAEVVADYFLSNGLEEILTAFLSLSEEQVRQIFNNLIAPKECTSANCAGEVTSGFLVGIEKADVFALAREYPEAFGRTFQADEGPDIDNWLV